MHQGKLVFAQLMLYPHHAYLFANQRANRIKILVHDGVGVWLAARRLHQGKFVWATPGSPNIALGQVLQQLPVGSTSTTSIGGAKWFRNVAANPGADLDMLIATI